MSLKRDSSNRTSLALTSMCLIRCKRNQRSLKWSSDALGVSCASVKRLQKEKGEVLFNSNKEIQTVQTTVSWWFWSWSHQMKLLLPLSGQRACDTSEFACLLKEDNPLLQSEVNPPHLLRVMCFMWVTITFVMLPNNIYRHKRVDDRHCYYKQYYK